MRISSTSAVLTLATLTLPTLALPTLATAQGSTKVNIPAFTRTFSSSTTRGLVFQAPVSFRIDAVEVPDETNAGVQNVELYVLPAQPTNPVPAFSATLTPQPSELVFSAYGAPVVAGSPLQTGGITVFQGEWVAVLGACGTTTMANSYGSTGAFQSDILGFPMSMERVLTQTNINTNNGPNALSTEIAGNIGRVCLYVSPPGSNVIIPPRLVALAEPTPTTAPLITDDQVIRDNDFIRYNVDDSLTSQSTGLLTYTIVNLGIGGSPATGQTPQIPRFIQQWAGSTPPGFALVRGPGIVGGGDSVDFVPAGVFANGDTIRLQTLVLDPRVATPTTFPVNPTGNTIEFRYTDCVVQETFDAGLTLPSGWVDGGGVRQWTVDANGTTSSATGPSAATSLPNYVYCETSSPAAAGDTFILNSPVYPSTTFVKGSIGFDLSRVGAAIGTLELRMDDGSGTFATVLGTWTGPEASGLEWTTEAINLPASLPANVQFQFHYTMPSPTPTGASSFQGDLAIDGFCLS